MSERASTGRALKVRDVANLYSVTPQVVYGWIRDGHIRPLRLPGRGSYRFRQADLDDFVERCRARDSTDPTIDSDDHETETVGTSNGPTPRVVALDPFQRGRQIAKPPKSGGTNG
jgi:excisionase family DNA binding protein